MVTVAEARKVGAHERITAQLVEAMEQGGAVWQQAWRTIGAGSVSAAGRAYRGGNALVLAGQAASKGYDAPVWATFRQWQEYGRKVRKGERATLVGLWKPTERVEADDDGERVRRGLVLRSFSVFSVAQTDAVEGWEGAEAPGLRQWAELDKGPRLDDSERVGELDAWLAATGAEIRHGGESAFYRPSEDRIYLPDFGRFVDAGAYYGTAAHELGHWTGHATRLAREGGKRFGDAAYALEELVAELCAAYCMGRLGVEAEPRADHAAYLASWCKGLRAEPRALWTVAKAAEAAAGWLFGERPDAAPVVTVADVRAGA